MTLSDAKAEAAKLEAAHAIALGTLSDMLDLPAGLSFALDPVDAVNRQLPSNYEHDAVISKVMHDRIDLKQAHLASEAASVRRDIAYARFSPSVNGFAKLERSYEGSPGYYPDKATSFGLQVSWELWDNGSRTYAVQEAVGEQRHADLVAQALERQIRLEVSQSLTNIKAAIEARKFAEASMKYAEEAYRVASIRFKSGTSTTTELLLAEEARDRAKGAVVSARTEVELRWFQLEKALGRPRPNQL
jgi:outer membrane protein TolC